MNDSTSPDLNRASMPNVWAMNICLRFNILRHSHSKRQNRKLFKPKSALSFMYQSLFATALAWLFSNIYAMTGSVPDVSPGTGLKWNDNWLLQTTDVYANLLLVVACVSGQFTWFIIIWRILRRTTLKYGTFALLPFMVFSSSLVLLLVRYQDLGLVYKDLYISSPQQFVMFLIPVSVIFFVGVESVIVKPSLRGSSGNHNSSKKK